MSNSKLDKKNSGHLKNRIKEIGFSFIGNHDLNKENLKEIKWIGMKQKMLSLMVHTTGTWIFHVKKMKYQIRYTTDFDIRYYRLSLSTKP